MKDKYIVLDRDGTLIKYKPYLYLPEMVELHKETKKALQLLIDNNCKLSVFKSLEGNINQKYDINTKHTIAWRKSDITTLNE